MLGEVVSLLLRGALAWLASDPAGHARRGVATVAMGAVVYNAAFAQDAQHGTPWFGETVELKVEEPPVRTAVLADPVVFGIQSELRELGYYDGAIDGLVGGRTRDAIRAYETSNGLPVRGQADAALLGRIRVASVRQITPPGGVSRDVATGSVEAEPPAVGGPFEADPTQEADATRTLQEGLKAFGFDVVVDGLRGPKTDAAIAAYAERRKLPSADLSDEVVISDMRAQGLVQ